MDGETTEQEQLASLILQRLPDFGPGRYWQLRQYFPSSCAILRASGARLGAFLAPAACDLLIEYQRDPANHHLYRQARRDLEWLADNGVTLLTPGDEHYPSLLSNIHNPPPLLYVRGCLENLDLPQLALVGSRNPSPTGKSNAFDFARQLCRGGFAVTSGLALGVDGAAHAGALAAGGRTLAVMGTGMDLVYPRRHQKLAEQIVAEEGTLISEFPLGTTAQPSHFPRRNRIISGLSVGVLVVEAAVRSGSLITARYAMQQGREVFAIPGSIHNPLSRGCHALLREGAALVETIDDLKEPLEGLLALKWNEVAPPEEKPDQVILDGDEAPVLKSLGYEDTPLDTVVHRSGLEIGRVLSALLQLELKGLVQQTPGGYQRAVRSPSADLSP